MYLIYNPNEFIFINISLNSLTVSTSPLIERKRFIQSKIRDCVADSLVISLTVSIIINIWHVKSKKWINIRKPPIYERRYPFNQNYNIQINTPIPYRYRCILTIEYQHYIEVPVVIIHLPYSDKPDISMYPVSTPMFPSSMDDKRKILY